MPKTSAMPAPQSGDLSGTFEEAILYDTAAYFDVSPPWLQGLDMSLSPGEQLELVIHVLQSIQITRFTLCKPSLHSTRPLKMLIVCMSSVWCLYYILRLR